MATGRRRWSGFELTYALLGGASVDADFAQQFSYIGDGVVGLGDGVYRLMAASDLASMAVAHNVEDSTLAIELTSGSAAQGPAVYLLLDSAPDGVTVESVVVSDDAYQR